MMIILIYDASSKVCNKIHKKCSNYLDWVQNSVFEGEITESNLKKLILQLSNLIDKNVDSIIIYTINNKDWIKRKTIGIEKNEISNIL